MPYVPEEKALMVLQEGRTHPLRWRSLAALLIADAEIREVSVMATEALAAAHLPPSADRDAYPSARRLRA